MNALPETPTVFSPPSRLRRIAPLLGLVLLAYVLARLDGAAMVAAVKKLHVGALCAAAVTFASNLLLKGLRWWRMLAAQNKPLSLPVALAAFFGSQFYGQVTLGRVGEFFRAEVLRERGESWASALSSCLVDRLFDVVAVCVLGLALGIVRLGWVFGTALIIPIAFGAFILIVLIAGASGVSVPRSVALRASAWIARAERRPWMRRAIEAGNDLLQSTRPLWRPWPLLQACMWTVASWTLYFAALWILADGLELHAPRVVLAGAASLAALSALLPVTISGLGAREVIYQKVLAAFEVSGETAVVLALAHLSVMTLTALSCGACGLWIRRRQRDQDEV